MNWINKLLIKLGLKKKPPLWRNEIEMVDVLNKAAEKTRQKFIDNINRPIMLMDMLKEEDKRKETKNDIS